MQGMQGSAGECATAQWVMGLRLPNTPSGLCCSLIRAGSACVHVSTGHLCREACLEVEGMRLQRLKPGVPLTLEALVEGHGTTVAAAMARLEQVGMRLLLCGQLGCACSGSMCWRLACQRVVGCTRSLRHCTSLTACAGMRDVLLEKYGFEGCMTVPAAELHTLTRAILLAPCR